MEHKLFTDIPSKDVKFTLFTTNPRTGHTYATYLCVIDRVPVAHTKLNKSDSTAPKVFIANSEHDHFFLLPTVTKRSSNKRP